MLDFAPPPRSATLGHGVTTSEPITIYVASFNTRDWTELCIRSLHQSADAPFRLVVGDSGSSDGSLETLTGMARHGWLELHHAREQRHHADWLDEWIATSPTSLALFCDSDVEFRRRRWLSGMVSRLLRTQAAMTCAEMIRECQDFVEPVGGKTVRLMPRPSPWLLLVDVERVRSLRCSFAFRAEPTDEVPEGLRAYDTGAYLYSHSVASGLRCEAMGRAFRRTYRHYGGASWRERRRQRRDLLGLSSARAAERRLSLLRLHRTTPSSLFVA